MKLNLVLTEWYTSTSWRKLEIDTDDYPELAGMTEEQAQQYIQDKYDAGDLNEVVENLGDKRDWTFEDHLRDADIVREKITNESEDISFE